MNNNDPRSNYNDNYLNTNTNIGSQNNSVTQNQSNYFPQQQNANANQQINRQQNVNAGQQINRQQNINVNQQVNQQQSVNTNKQVNQQQNINQPHQNPYVYNNAEKKQKPQQNNYQQNPNQQRVNNGNTPPNTPHNNNQYYHSQFSNPPVVMKVHKRIFDKVDKAFGWLAIAIGFLFILTIGSLWFDFGIGATIFFEISLIISYCYTIKRKMKVDIWHNISFFLLMILSLSFSFFSNSLALAGDFLFLTLAQAYWMYSVGEEKEDNFLNELMTSIIVYPFMNYGAIYSAIFKKNGNNQKGNLKWILLGLCIALPLVCIVSSLLITSDEMFKAMFSAIFDDFLIKVFKYLWYAIVGLPIAMAVFSIWYTKYTEDKKLTSSNADVYGFAKQNKIVTNYRIAPPALMYAIAIPLCCVYFLYLISQVAYFISFIADNLLPKDYTIVDYARNGFFELCVVATINVILILLLLLLTKRPNNNIPTGLRVISVLMSIFTLFFIGTALYKMFMYIKTYGYTPARINTIVFMSFLLVVFALIIAKQFIKNMKLPAIVMVVAIVFMLGYNIIDVDSFVARQNIKLYEEGKIPWMGIDLVYDLDYSALEYIAPFASDEDNGLDAVENYRLNRELHDRYDEHNKSYSINNHKDVFSFNFNEYRVHKVLESYDYDEDYEYSYDYDYDYDYDYSYSY